MENTQIKLSPEIREEITRLYTREINKLKEEHKKEIQNIRLENELEKAIVRSGAKTVRAVRALIDTEKAELDENGRLSGIDEQLEALRNGEDTKYLFKEKEKASFRGVSIGRSEKKEKDVGDMSYDEICAYLDGGKA